MTMYGSESNERREEILYAAADLFSSKGYKATSIRDVADKVGILAGSLYHHIRSKDALFLEVHGLILARDAQRLREALAEHDEPWDRFEAMCVALAEIALNPGSTALNIVDDFDQLPDSMGADLARQRETFDVIIQQGIESLGLRKGIDREMLYLCVKAVFMQTAKVVDSEIRQAQTMGQLIFAIFDQCRASE